MRGEEHEKVRATHLKRDAYLYIRQSTLRQVFDHRESTQRQYGLRRRAVALGWPAEQLVVIDNDLGHSAASTADREGFQRLVAEVGMGKAGIVMGLEVSRLARNCLDWHRLLEICALSDTLILDEDGLYDPQQFNDRLVLGLKGTMSEAELHLLRARLRGGILNKAQRGELKTPLPVGLVYDSQDGVVLDPDQQVQHSLRFFFETYRRTGSALATVKAFRQQGLWFPRRLRLRERKGELVWNELQHTRALQVLHNPRYAGAFVFGRTHTRKQAEGRVVIETLAQDEWHTLLVDAHPGYISWPEYQDNQRRLRQAAQAHGVERRKSPPREGPALLQGLLICGICGGRMTLRYHQRGGWLVPDYMCQKEGIERGRPICQQIPGRAIDQAVGKRVVETLTPMTLEVTLTVQQELQSRLEEADRLRHQQVERARYEAELARRRYMQVDPDNRLVADSLEADWNEKLRALSRAQEEYERGREVDRTVLDEEQRQKLLALARDIPRLWHNPKTPQRERKRMIRLLLEDVTLTKGDPILVQIRFKGGATETLRVPRSLNAWQLRLTAPEVVAELDHLLEHHPETKIAEILNQKGFLSGMGLPFHPKLVAGIRRKYGLKSRYDRLREQGMLTARQLAQQLGVSPQTVSVWRRNGLLIAHPYNGKNECLYEPPGDNPPAKMQGQKLSERRIDLPVTPDRTDEVQYDS